jgi:hypothetical protein
MRRIVVVGVIVVAALAVPVLAFGTGGSVRLHLRAQKAGAPLGIVSSPSSSALTRLDPSTLLPVGRPVQFATSLYPIWAYSPDRSRIVLANTSSRLYVVDTRVLRITSSVRKPAFNDPLALGWIDGRVLAVMAGLDVPQLFVVNPRGGRVAAWDRTLPGQFVAAARVPGQLVLLLAPPSGVGACMLATADATGTLRTVQLPDVRCGWDALDEDGAVPPAIEHEAVPGLAVDPAGGRAFVVPGDSTVTEVDLQALTVSRHDLAQRRPGVLDGFFGWLAPAAQAKGVPDGPWRQALWLGGGILAAWGTDYHGSIAANGDPQFEAAPAGATLVDTRTWTTSVLDAEAGLLVRSGASLLTTPRDGGLTVFGRDGSARLHLLADRQVWPQAGFGRVIASPLPSGRRYWVVDPALGRIVKAVPSPSAPILLAAAASP